jgi:hypothetical protein
VPMTHVVPAGHEAEQLQVIGMPVFVVAGCMFIGQVALA